MPDTHPPVLALRPDSAELLRKAEALLATIGLSVAQAADIRLAQDICDVATEDNTDELPGTPSAAWDMMCDGWMEDAYEARRDQLCDAASHVQGV